MITKEQFEKIINGIKTQSKIDNDFATIMGKIFPNAFGGNLLPPTNTIINTIIDFLKDIMGDKYDYIDYYIFELDFGSRKDLGVYDENDNKIKLETPSDLYDCIILSKNIE